jgi:hypothetical protein
MIKIEHYQEICQDKIRKSLFDQKQFSIAAGVPARAVRSRKK